MEQQMISSTDKNKEHLIMLYRELVSGLFYNIDVNVNW